MRKKLTSRKFWAAIATAAYFGGMAIKEQGNGSQLASIVYGICMGGVIVAWIIIEGFCDHDDECYVEEVEEDYLEESDEDDD